MARVDDLWKLPRRRDDDPADLNAVIGPVNAARAVRILGEQITADPQRSELLDRLFAGGGRSQLAEIWKAAPAVSVDRLHDAAFVDPPVLLVWDNLPCGFIERRNLTQAGAVNLVDGMHLVVEQHQQ